MQRRSVSEFKYSLEESGFTLKALEFKSQMDDNQSCAPSCQPKETHESA